MIEPSELEGCVLGHLWKFGPCTAYSIRRMLLVSPSTHWSGSAGAIYPLLARFEQRGLVASRKAMRGDRAGWLYALTATGRRRFLTWLGPPLTADVVSITTDPLRTRLFFLGALPARRRAAFFESARAALERHLEEVAPTAGMDPFERLAHRAAVRMTRARLAGLDEARRAVVPRKRTRR